MNENPSTHSTGSGQGNFWLGFFIGGFIGAVIIVLLGSKEGKKFASKLLDEGELWEENLEEKIKKLAEKGEELLAEAQRIEGILGGNGAWIPIKNRVSTDVKKNIEALEIAGIGFDPEPTRNYPEGSASAHILGFVGKDDKGSDREVGN